MPNTGKPTDIEGRLVTAWGARGGRSGTWLHNRLPSCVNDISTKCSLINAQAPAFNSPSYMREWLFNKEMEVQ